MSAASAAAGTSIIAPRATRGGRRPSRARRVARASSRVARRRVHLDRASSQTAPGCGRCRALRGAEDGAQLRVEQRRLAHAEPDAAKPEHAMAVDVRARRRPMPDRWSACPSSRSNVRIVTGRGANARIARLVDLGLQRARSPARSRPGRPSPRSSNSERNRPIAIGVLARGRPATSSTRSTLASSRIRDAVARQRLARAAPGGLRRRLPARSRRAAPRQRRAAGSTMSSPAVPSTTTGIPGPDVLGRLAEADHGRDAERARKDRGVRGAAAGVDGQPGDAAPIHLRGHRRRRVVGDQHERARRLRQQRVPASRACRRAGSCAPAGDVGDIAAAARAGRVVDVVKERRHLVERALHGPLGVDLLLADQRARPRRPATGRRASGSARRTAAPVRRPAPR